MRFVTARKISVLVAEDSQIVRMLLVHLLEADAQLRVVGAVGDGQAAVDFVVRHGPDVVLMDIYMPRLDGFEATRRIMEARPVPIVICTATASPHDLVITFRAMEAGAIACIEKPVSPDHAAFAAIAGNLVNTVKLMSEVKVVKRAARTRKVRDMRDYAALLARPGSRIDVVGIGASTGGPPVLQAILARLPADFPAPVLVVQHIARGFVDGLVEWLAQSARLQVHVASHDMPVEAGHVYLAPDDVHMGISAPGTIVLVPDASENHVRPAVSFLFRSLTAAHGRRAVGVLLTGMGKDGAAELRRMKDAGAVTIAQDQKTSVVHGMPGAAIALDAATHVLPAEEIADALMALARGGTTNGGN